MNKFTTPTLIFTAAIAYGPVSWAASVTTLNTFTSGETAVAADVNDNFTAVKTAVDANDTDITTNATDITTNATDISTNVTAIGVNTTHRTGNGSDHADVATNTTANTADAAHRTGDGSDHADVATNTTHSTGNGSDHADVVTNTAHSSGDGSDHAEVATNTTHSTGDGSDHADVAANTTAVAALQGNVPGSGCTGVDGTDMMVRVGPLCVDKYEASVWSAADGSVSGNQFGVGSDDYDTAAVDGITCSDNANDCTGAHTIYARSEATRTPSTYITWYQAQQACAASGKRLLTNAEWQMAAAGTPDIGAADNTTSDCAVSSSLSATGSRSLCVSNWAVNDMAGNVAEWVADWIPGTGTAGAWSTGPSTAGTDYGDDWVRVNAATNQGTNSTGQPSTIYRGGDFDDGTDAGIFAFGGNAAPSLSDASVGFRCAR